MKLKICRIFYLVFLRATHALIELGSGVSATVRAAPGIAHRTAPAAIRTAHRTSTDGEAHVIFPHTSRCTRAVGLAQTYMRTVT